MAITNFLAGMHPPSMLGEKPRCQIPLLCVTAGCGSKRVDLIKNEQVSLPIPFANQTWRKKHRNGKILHGTDYRCPVLHDSYHFIPKYRGSPVFEGHSLSIS